MSHQIIAVFLIGLTILMTASGGATDELDYDRVQTYGMLPLDPEKAAAKGLTVNGIWAGYGMPEAVRSGMHVVSGGNDHPVQWKYPTMEGYIELNHQAGLLVPASVMGIAGHVNHRKRFPEMELGSCVGADGTRSYWIRPSEGAYFMCMNNPIYPEVMFSMFKEALDAGADLVLIDEIQGNEFCFYWDNQPGFCDHCLKAYRTHLRNTYAPQELTDKFRIEDLESFDFAARLDGQRGKPWADTDPLFKELHALQTRLSFEVRGSIVGRVRAYMNEVGRMVPVCANVPSVGVLSWGEGHRFFGLKWAQICDFLTMETGERDRYTLPRGKWVAYERLAASVFRLPSAVLHLYGGVHAMEMDYMAGKNNRNVYLYGMLAEANANGCHYVNYFTSKFFPDTEPFWDTIYHAQKFIRDHRDLFEPESETGANVAVLYIENEGQRWRTETYLGLVQALAESNIPFDLLTDGGDSFVPVTLTADKMKQYQLVVIPNALHLEPTQRDAIETYVRGGGRVLAPDPGEFGLDDEARTVERGEGTFIVLPQVKAPDLDKPSNLGDVYHHTYLDSVRRQIAELVNTHSDPVLEVPNADRTLTVYPHYQTAEQRILVHAINSDYEPEHNRMRPREQITIRLKQPDFYRKASPARVYSPDFDTEQIVTPMLDDGFIELTLPKLDVYSVVVLTGAS